MTPSPSLAAFAYLVTVLMFARVDLYADRPRRPGLSKIASALLLATVIALVFALANGAALHRATTSSTARCLRHVYSAVPAVRAHAGHRLAARQAGYRRRALLVGSGERQIEAVAQALGEPLRTATST